MVDVRTNWQNAQMTLVAHKRSSTSDTRQNQLAECPNSTSTHKQPSTEPIGRHSQMGRLPACTPVDLSSLGARQLIPNASFHSTRKSGKLAASAEQGRSRGGSSKQTVLAAARNVPQVPLSRPEKHKQQDHHHHPGTSPWPMALLGQIPGASCLESTASRWAPKTC